ncbi:hypothetical protein EDC96DRAFT_328336 [Choanephora cucurbitarum]|nr:hypothetical protein EDC96DRAFT_328336 [Choanephora cucurbitarum]
MPITIDLFIKGHYHLNNNNHNISIIKDHYLPLLSNHIHIHIDHYLLLHNSHKSITHHLIHLIKPVQIIHLIHLDPLHPLAKAHPCIIQTCHHLNLYCLLLSIRHLLLLFDLLLVIPRLIGHLIHLLNHPFLKDHLMDFMIHHIDHYLHLHLKDTILHNRVLDHYHYINNLFLLLLMDTTLDLIMLIHLIKVKGICIFIN